MLFIFFFPQTIGTKPIAHIDQFTPEMLGSAELAEQVSLDGSGKLVKVRRYTDLRTASLKCSLQLTGVV